MRRRPSPPAWASSLAIGSVLGVILSFGELLSGVGRLSGNAPRYGPGEQRQNVDVVGINLYSLRPSGHHLVGLVSVQISRSQFGIDRPGVDAHGILGKKAFADLDQVRSVCTAGVVDFLVGLEFVLTGAPIGIRLFLIERSAALALLIFFIFLILILVLGRCCRD